jgi:hypothetical protein
VPESLAPNSNQPGQSQDGNDSMVAVAEQTTKMEAALGEQYICHPTAVTVPLVVVACTRIEASLDSIAVATITLISDCSSCW